VFFIYSINFNIMQIIYYQNISYDESKSTSIIFLKLIKDRFDQTLLKLFLGGSSRVSIAS
jgi:hypothetical protein